MGKKKATKKGAKIIDGVATNEMSREQLMGHVKRMQTELNREREERNFFMLEREKLYALWNITMEKLEEAKNETRLADVRMDDNEREREGEMNIYKQKLRFLMTEQSRRVAEVRLSNLQHIKNLQQSTSAIELGMRSTIEKKNRELSKNQNSMYQLMRQLQLDNAANGSKLKSDFCAELRRIESTFERLLFEREEEQRIHEAVEIQRTNTQKSEHINSLMKLHEKQMGEMKSYFNEITANNFAVISALQEELGRMREREEELKLEVQKGRRDLKKLESKLLEEKEQGEKKLRDDRKCAQEIRRRLESCDKRLKHNDKYARVLELENEALLEKAQLASREKEMLKGSMTRAIVDMQKKANMQKLVLEMKLAAFSHRRAEDGSDSGEGDSASSLEGHHEEEEVNVDLRHVGVGSDNNSSADDQVSDDNQKQEQQVKIKTTKDMHDHGDA